jgi:hypothetical protein
MLIELSLCEFWFGYLSSSYRFRVFNSSSQYSVPFSVRNYQESDASAIKKLQLNDYGKVIGRVDTFCRSVPGR